MYITESTGAGNKQKSSFCLFITCSHCFFVTKYRRKVFR
uniref:Uncharacterized protein n=1 Tax=Klebsiella pneumoniae TaxID=573 RepID=A0A8B0SP72_KLEPN|nr:hypothetical protein [Klebsiella pneumoniae]